MGAAQPIGFVEGNPSAINSDTILALTGPWQLAYGGTNLRLGLDIRDGTSEDLLFNLAYRTAEVDTNNPDAWNITTSTNYDEDGPHTASLSLSGETAMWVQAGVFAKLASGTTPLDAYVRLWSSVVGSGWLVGRQRIVLEPGVTNKIVPVANPFGAAGVTGLRFGMIYTGISGTLTAPTPCYRTFKTGDMTDVESWNTGTAGSNVTADTKVLATQATTTTSALYVQPGFKYTSTSLNYGVVDIIVAAKK